jgi:hypothetical protein
MSFIDSKYAAKLAEVLNSPILPLGWQTTVTGYDGKAAAPLTHYMRNHLVVNGHRQPDIPMFVLDLGDKTPFILGRHWFAHFKVLVDVANKRLVWPKEPIGEVHTPFLRELKTTYWNLMHPRKEPKHQADADRRDKALEAEVSREPRRTILPRPREATPPTSATTYEED